MPTPPKCPHMFPSSNSLWLDNQSLRLLLLSSEMRFLDLLMVLWFLGFGIGLTSSMSTVQVQTHCTFTRFPGLCRQTLEESIMGHSTIDVVISTLVNKTISETNLPDSYFTVQTSNLEFQQAQHAQSLTDYCNELMMMSLKRLDQSILALKDSPRKNKNDIQTWLSSVLTFQQACKDSAENFGHLATHISSKMDKLSQLTSNPLALINRITTSKRNNDPKPVNFVKTRRLAEKEKDFPSWVSMKDRKLLQTNTIKANAVVAKDGTGNYNTVTEAINAASGGRFVIYVKSGVYKEKIRTSKDGITLIGDGKDSTIIVSDDSVGGGSSMPGSATFTITGDGFIARDIGFQNTAGPGGEQALALYVASDHSVVYRCSISGYQDTLYALALRQFYRECDIYGTIDFIFGNAAAVFQNCYLALRRPHGYNAILANGRTDPGQSTGFILQNCRIAPASDLSAVKHKYKSYLGRPWKQYSRAIVMESNIDDAISSQGWVEWPGAGSYGKTLYFAEYSNTGPGAGISSRVNWPGFHVMGTPEADKFTVANFISGTSWLPSTGVTFISGLQ